MRLCGSGLQDAPIFGTPLGLGRSDATHWLVPALFAQPFVGVYSRTYANRLLTRSLINALGGRRA